VDASPEHLRPRFDGGTGVRTVFANSSSIGWLYPNFCLGTLLSTMVWVEERKSEVQPKDGVDIYLRCDFHLELVKQAYRNRHLGEDDSEQNGHDILGDISIIFGIVSFIVIFMALGYWMMMLFVPIFQAIGIILGYISYRDKHKTGKIGIVIGVISIIVLCVLMYFAITSPSSGPVVQP